MANVEKRTNWTPENFGVTGVFSPTYATPSGVSLVDASGSALPAYLKFGTPVPAYANVEPKAAAQAANYLATPGLIPEEQKSVTKSWIQRLFDTTDESNWVGESVWDGMLKSLTWTYDRIAQAESWSLSALPGGVETYSWEQANQISPGQTAVGNVIYDYNRIFGNVSDFDILDEQQRQQVFKDNVVGKIASGGVDLGLSLFADPLLVAGKAAKITRLKYLDKLYTSPEELTKLGTDLDDALKMWRGAGSTDEVSNLHPVAQAVIWATRKNPDGTPMRSVQEIASHQVFRQADNIEAVTSVMMAADTAEEGALAVRYMLGDMSVVPLLKKMRADLMDEIGITYRKRLELTLTANPQTQAKLIDTYKKRFDKYVYEFNVANERVSQASEFAGRGYVDPSAEFAYKQMLQAEEDLRMVKEFRVPDPAQVGALTREAAAQELSGTTAALKQLRDRDKFFQKALSDEEANVSNVYGQLMARQRSFSSDTAIGRAAEQSRQARATAAYKQQATRRAQTATGERVKGWEKDVFGTPGITRLTNLWRWAGNELPSGRIATHGAAAHGSSRELIAVLNDVSIYSGEAKQIKYMTQEVVRDAAGKIVKDANGKAVKKAVEKTAFVGGTARKEEILRRFIDTANAAPNDLAIRKRLLDDLENAITDDIAAWHGMDANDMKKVTDMAKTKRNDLISNIKSTGYWVDEAGNQNKAPFLDSHLQDATYLLNFRAIEKATEAFLVGDKARIGAKAREYTSDRLSELAQGFHEVWRPATLLRLGYTQRNVTEGLIRATAFMFASDPVRFGRSLNEMTAAAKRATAPLRNVSKGVAAGAENIKVGRTLEREIAKIEKAGPHASKMFVKWRNTQLAAADNDIDGLENILTFFRNSRDEAVAEKDWALESVIDRNVKFFEDRLANTKVSREALEDDAIALINFRNQGKAKSRIYSGDTGYQTSNPWMMREAFNDRNGYGQIAWANMSSDGSRKLESMLAADGVSHIFIKKMQREFVTVKPGEAGYFEGVARVLMQFKNSTVGEMLINGAARQDIATYLRKDPNGRAIAEFIGMSRPAGEKGFRIIDLDDALEYVDEMARRLQQIAPNPELLTAIKSIKHVDEGVVKKFLEGRTDLRPVIGNFAADIGTHGFLESYKKLAHIGFRYLGTLPEDALVRGPFYGQRFNEIRDQLVSNYMQQTPEKYVTAQAIEKIHALAHGMALKDTKQWLYTIERRTNLGQLGEYVFPFISATQNSVTTFGRLIWNDPRIGVAMMKMWQAPEKMGIEDENGNIVVGIPHGLIPDAVEKAVGLDNMMNIKINKNGLNVIFPQAGEMPLPSPGPLVTVPASELMKHGWFGMSVDAPAMMKAAIGEKNANEMWDLWKTYLFGEGQGVSDKLASYDLVLPPWMQKAIQMKDGELNSTAYAYQYSLQMRTETAKYVAGYRDEMPTADEIKERTNGLYMLRILGNLTAFTPPQYVSKLQPLIDAVKRNKELYGVDAGRINSDMFGDYLLTLGDFSVSKNLTGATASTQSYSNARKYASLLERVSPEVQDDLTTLSLILNAGTDDVADLYDPSTYSWQFASNIPGLAKKFREMQSPQQSMVDSQKKAGWVAFTKGMDVLNAILQQRGLKSFRNAGAADLKAAKDAMIARLSQDPLYAGWYDDYINFGSARTVNSVEVLTAALSDPQFMQDHGGESVWQTASVYLAARQQVLSGQMTLDQWDEVRGTLAQASPQWGQIADRYLNGDEDPMAPGVSLATIGVANG